MAKGKWTSAGEAVVAVVIVLMLTGAGCGSSSGEDVATSTTEAVALRLTVHALGGGVTWTGECDVGDVRVTLADGSGTTLAVEMLPLSGTAGADRFADCTTDTATVAVPPSPVYRLTVAGAGPLDAPW